jgi:hypothetical protein
MQMQSPSQKKKTKKKNQKKEKKRASLGPPVGEQRQEVATSALCEYGSGAPRRRALPYVVTPQAKKRRKKKPACPSGLLPESVS